MAELSAQERQQIEELESRLNALANLEFPGMVATAAGRKISDEYLMSIAALGAGESGKEVTLALKAMVNDLIDALDDVEFPRTSVDKWAEIMQRAETSLIAFNLTSYLSGYLAGLVQAGIWQEVSEADLTP